MKIIIVNTLYHPFKIGGAEVSVQLLAEELVLKGHHVRVISLHDLKKRMIENINGVEVVYLPLKNIYWPFDNNKKGKLKRLLWHIIDMYNIPMAQAVSKEIDDFKPDVVHTNNIAGFSVAVWAAIKKSGKKLVHTSRDYYLFHPNSTMFHKDRNIEPDENIVHFWSFIKRIASKNVDYYVGISNFIKKFHEENDFFPNATSSYIYNAVEEPSFNATESKALRFGFVGRLTKDKGFDVFCQLIDHFKKHYPNASFSAAGRFSNNDSLDELQILANEKGVNLLGFVPINQFFQQVDVVVLPIKWREPFGRVVVESALANKIVLTNSVGGISELKCYFSKIKFIEDIDAIDLEINSSSINNNKIFTRSEIANKYIEVYIK
ncbi:glycosyltransferase [Serratia fonticola]|uniref:glycosyltransferase family 4 protein n=1 Tax=Serratia fonticola TaxID=47917 RepID=UPI0013789171|nr:glycosyltransferase family 4 protein [Serratia fonticola]NBJ33780.1 glycosyltransferase [Serratia fonticola]